MRGTVSSVEYTVASGVSKSADWVVAPSMSFLMRGCLIKRRPRLLPIVVEPLAVELPIWEEYKEVGSSMEPVNTRMLRVMWHFNVFFFVVGLF